MSEAPPSVDEAAEYAAEQAELFKGSHRALWRRFRRQPIELRQFAGPEEHVQMVDHLRVAHLTDMHFGRVTPERVQREAIRMTNAQAPDLVVITGDFVCHSQMYLEQLTSVLSELQAPTIGVLGNHDYWSGADEVHRALRKAGVEILKNRNTVITLRHERLQIVGLDDAYTGHADRWEAVKGLRKDLPTVGLSHIAEEADWLWNHDVPLVLAGHTHAGQVTLARLHELAVDTLGAARVPRRREPCRLRPRRGRVLVVLDVRVGLRVGARASLGTRGRCAVRRRGGHPCLCSKGRRTALGISG